MAVDAARAKSLFLAASDLADLTASADNAWLWHTATGKQIGLPLQHQNLVSCVALSADGETAMTGSLDKNGEVVEDGDRQANRGASAA
jgi:hypothetical protein